MHDEGSVDAGASSYYVEIVRAACRGKGDKWGDHELSESVQSKKRP